MGDGTGIDAARSEQARARRLERWQALLSGTGEGLRTQAVRRGGPVNLMTGVWLHAAARYEQGLELTELEQALLEPLKRVLGEEEVRGIGSLYLGQRRRGAVALVPQTVARRDLEQGFTREQYWTAVRELVPLIGAMPNMAVMDAAVLASGEAGDSPQFTAALGEYGFGVTGYLSETGSEETNAARSHTSFRARLEWSSFYCHKAVGDQWGGRDEIYWTAACNAADYQHTTRTGETGSVTEGESYPVAGDHVSGDKAFFDTTLAGCGTSVITIWEADQSNAEWYAALGEALQQVVDSLKYHDMFLSLMPNMELLGHMYTAVSMLATIWESLRNKDDLVLTRGIAFGPSALGAIYESQNHTASWRFDASSEGMGDFSLTVRYTGDEPVVPVGSSSLISAGWPGLAGTAYTAGLDAVCNVPTSASDLYLFKGEQYLRYNALTEEIVAGPKSIAGSWTGLDGTAFTYGIDAACQVPGTTTDVYLFKGPHYMRYNVSTEKAHAEPDLIMFNWPGLFGTSFMSGVDAACPVPGHTNDLYLFKGDQYVRYDRHAEKIVNGPWSISAGWPSVQGTTFAYSLSAACATPGSNDVIYLFKNDRYRRYTI
ncbi:hypothetical protein [Streptomyces sp. NPDC047014]|uniref:hypothetical protein n=1 Tax=Streptomyces sp. NPDC047014 TaxID=3155736 RepID=UPI0033D85417